MKIERVNLSHITSIRLKGYRDVAFVDSENDLHSVDTEHLLGAGSNILVKSNVMLYKFSHNFSYIKKQDNVIVMGAAAKMSDIMKFCISNNIAGLEFLYAVPCSIGGAVYMNASAFSRSIGDIFSYAKIYSAEKGITYIDKNSANFFYRETSLHGYIILEVALNYKVKERSAIISIAKNYIHKRLSAAHIRNTFGSVFKNPKNSELTAGEMVDQCGLKGVCRNSAAISEKHGNFIVGSMETEFEDIAFLMDKAKNGVYKQFGINLEEEVKII